MTNILGFPAPSTSPSYLVQTEESFLIPSPATSNLYGLCYLLYHMKYTACDFQVLFDFSYILTYPLLDLKRRWQKYHLEELLIKPIFKLCTLLVHFSKSYYHVFFFVFFQTNLFSFNSRKQRAPECVEFLSNILNMLFL